MRSRRGKDNSFLKNLYAILDFSYYICLKQTKTFFYSRPLVKYVYFWQLKLQKKKTAKKKKKKTAKKKKKKKKKTNKH